MFNLFKKKEVVNPVNPQVEFDNLIKNIILPILKENSFKKQGNNFTREVEDYSQCINIQKSQWNNKDNISFVINVGFYNEKIFKETSLNPVIPKFPKVYNCFIQTRAGCIVNGYDKWFKLNNKTNIFELENEIKESINTVISLLNNHLTMASSEELVNKYSFSGLSLSKISFLAHINKKDEAQKIFNESYKIHLAGPYSSSATINYPDGSSKTEIIYPNDDLKDGWTKRYKDLADIHGFKLE